MAKSLRSKRRRKMRGIKREGYAKKELVRLKDMIQKSKEAESEMKELVTVRRRRPVVKADQEQLEADTEDGEGMDTTKPKPKVDPNTLKTENGNYPVWMNQRQVRKKKREVKKIVKERARKKRQKF